MHHIVAWYEDIDPATAFVPIAAVPEQVLTTQGDDIRVPAALPFIIGAAALIDDASGLRAQVASPSLRVFTNIDIEPIVLAQVWGAPPEVLFHPERAIPVQPDESLNFFVESDPAAIEVHYGLVVLADGPQTPVVQPFFSVLCEPAIAQAVDVWTNGVLNFQQVLPAGTYQVIGLRVRSVDGVAGRLVFQEQMPRPGVPCVNVIGDADLISMRHGNSGVWGTFQSTNPPTLDVLGGVAAAQHVILDLVRIA